MAHPPEIQVSCYSGYKAEDTPRHLYLDGRKVSILEILDRWLEPDHRWFKLRGDDGNVYIIRHDNVSGRWELANR